jgi:hypothetical protein
MVQMMESARLVRVTFFKKAKIIFLVGSECNVLGLFLEYVLRNYFKLCKAIRTLKVLPRPSNLHMK